MITIGIGMRDRTLFTVTRCQTNGVGTQVCVKTVGIGTRGLRPAAIRLFDIPKTSGDTNCLKTKSGKYTLRRKCATAQTRIVHRDLYLLAKLCEL